MGLRINFGYETNRAKLVIYQLIAGVGTELYFEGPLLRDPPLSLQAATQLKDTATATTTFGFMRTISTAISVIVGGVVFQKR